MDLMETAQLLGNFGEFVGSIAVVVTLAYLAIQVRHSRAATEVNPRWRNMLTRNRSSPGTWWAKSTAPCSKKNFFCVSVITSNSMASISSPESDFSWAERISPPMRNFGADPALRCMSLAPSLQHARNRRLIAGDLALPLSPAS